MRTTPLIGRYWIATENERPPNPQLDPTDINARCTAFLTLYSYFQSPETWLPSPFAKQNPNRPLTPSSIRFQDVDGIYREGAIISAKLTNEGIALIIDRLAIQTPVGGMVCFSAIPDDSWPKLDNIWTPNPGVVMFEFPAIWEAS